MASGITHILLSKKLQDELPEGALKDILDEGSDFLTVGSIGTDLPYASKVEDLFLSDQSDLADLFHYDKTNLIPLLALERLKQ